MPRAPRIYRLLLRLLPPSFRREFGADLEAVLADRLRDAGGSGARVRIWLVAVWDVITTAAAEWTRPSGRRQAKRVTGSRLDDLTVDLRFALRSLRRWPGFTAVAVITLGLGVGAVTAIFSVVYTVLLRPLEYPDAERIVAVETIWTNSGRSSPEVSGPDFLDWQAETEVFETLAHYAGEEDVAIVVGGRAAFANDMYVSPGFFPVFGQRPAAGRLLLEEDVPAGDALPAVVVVRHGWAEAHFGSAEAAIGETIVVYDMPMRIVGVAAPGFSFPGATDLWAPWRTSDSDRADLEFQVVGKLAAGMDMARAKARMRALGDALARQHPENSNRSVSVAPLQERLTGDVQLMLWVLMGAVLLVLLIACANISNLLLARAATRTREVALRGALGAGRARLVRQLLTESAVLGTLAAGAGVVLAFVLVQAIVALSPADLPRLDEVTIDGVVLLFAVSLGFATALLFGAAPAIHASRLDLSLALTQGGGRGATATGSGRTRAALVAAEVALSVILLAGAGLLLRSFQALQQEDLGFTTDRVLVAYTQYPISDDEDRRNRTRFYADFVERLRAVRGVDAAAGVAFLPLGREPIPARDYFVRGRPEGLPGERPQAEFQAITPGYFEALEIPILAGRDFNRSDTEGRPWVVIVNEALSRAAFPGESPIGRQIRAAPQGAPWAEIVGVVADTRWQDPSRPAPQIIYAASAQGVGGSLSILSRTSLDEASLAATMRELLREMKPAVPVRIDTMEQLFDDALAHPRFRTQLVGAFAGTAVLLAAVGIFGVLAWLVGQRTREIAVRRAMGARTGDVVRLVLGPGLRSVAIGLAAGLAGALAAARLLRGLLHEVGPFDLGTYVGAVAVLGGCALLAMLVAVMRAVGIAPLRALQHE